MNGLLLLFSNNILPILLAAASGLLIARFLGVNPEPISQIAFYIFSPCLIFDLLTSNQLHGEDITQMVGFTIVLLLTLGVVTALIGLLFGLNRGILLALILTVMFGNTGNFGLSLNLFAFGESALAHASLFFVTTAILLYTVGVVLASWGKSSFRRALLGVLKVPAIYAVLLALIFIRFDLSLPLPINRTVSILSDAAIPVMMVLMGVQLYNSKWSKRTSILGLSNVLRLVVSPVMAIGIAMIFHLEGAAYQAGVIEAAVPTAVLMTVLATEYNIEPAFMTTAVFTSTLLSPLTLTPILAFLGA